VFFVLRLVSVEKGKENLSTSLIENSRALLQATTLTSNPVQLYLDPSIFNTNYITPYIGALADIQFWIR
jgi:hypothetical protein